MSYNWPNMEVIPRHGLAAWHQHEPGVSANGLINDYSGNDRHLVAASNAPVLTDDIVNGQPGWYFNGSRNPLAWSGSVTLRHVFIVASFEDEEFPSARGLMSGLTTGNILSTNGSGDKFADTGADTYRLFGQQKDSNDQIAPVDGQIGLIEVVYDDGVALDGIQIGKKLEASELHKGHFVEAISYEHVLGEMALLRVYQYIAMRYHIWQQGA